MMLSVQHIIINNLSVYIAQIHWRHFQSASCSLQWDGKRPEINIKYVYKMKFKLSAKMSVLKVRRSHTSVWRLSVIAKISEYEKDGTKQCLVIMEVLLSSVRVVKISALYLSLPFLFSSTVTHDLTTVFVYLRNIIPGDNTIGPCKKRRLLYSEIIY